MFERILKQQMMNRVLYALIPVLLFSIYLFGLRVLAVVAIANIAAYYTEYLFIYKKKGGKVSMAAFVTASLVSLSLPPTIPLWISAVAAIVSIAFGKMVFGGFGTNIFNPAILGRTFVYISFPNQMTISWLKPYLLKDFPGGFVKWSTESGMQTGATILNSYRSSSEALYSFQDAFLGFISGSAGETSALLILLAGIYLIITKTAKWQSMLGTALSLLLFSWIFNPSVNPFYFLVSGGAMFGVVYMVTDPISSPKGKYAIWIYGLLVGFLTVYIRRYSLFAEGFMFALLLTNAFMPLIEYGLEKAGVK
ncbi:MAG: RnfABCDGE type electron transport complex subunit D [Candidatus Cloacimonetes bacterium]|jgi:Na+-transporting NADH:ubiquinone oxidoreductase subunit B|nr:RnfABCDGE type electron transport complex subunit D [Candidatus Cloacimonadota bacterium]MDY0337684.1 RnfABCDGE type electron transport complex subunit D [Candidatus Cloacimonadaceae bacterium]MCB5268604.1 RnfABCDGE type electron transport complex subunit D [Candidatus Cloacimonadota bacterium]MCK9333910.1 RnfABCDGE type electron transport complex subunit D [Candidatus Cloacimonadota bacterium]MDD2544194.1 RnfABCDGE type electron transport complex subunit D [Candidatus Cloacimonadota bacteri